MSTRTFFSQVWKLNTHLILGCTFSFVFVCLNKNNVFIFHQQTVCYNEKYTVFQGVGPFAEFPKVLCQANEVTAQTERCTIISATTWVPLRAWCRGWLAEILWCLEWQIGSFISNVMEEEHKTTNVWLKGGKTKNWSLFECLKWHFKHCGSSSQAPVVQPPPCRLL